VAPLDLTTVRYPLTLMPRIRAIDLPMVAESTQVHDLPTVIDDTLDLPQIVHRWAQPPGTRPPLATRATTHPSNASTRG
jgi:hypothetical protein